MSIFRKFRRGASKVWKKVKKPAMIAGGLAAAKFGGPALLGRMGAFGANAATMGSSARAAATAIGGFASKHSGLLGAGVGLVGQRMANVGSAQQASRQMDFQERMSSTAHQRQVEDLKAAGLNPILSANAGASAPGGAMGQVGNIGDAAVSSAVDARRSKAEVDNLREQNRGIAAQTRQTEATTDMLLPWQQYLLKEQSFSTAAQAHLASVQASNASFDNERLRLRQHLYEQPGGSAILARELAGNVGAATHSAGALWRDLKGSNWWRRGGPGDGPFWPRLRRSN